MMTIDDCKAKQADLVGGKIDLRKCFDTIAAEQAITLWEEWGSAERDDEDSPSTLPGTPEVGRVQGQGGPEATTTGQISAAGVPCEPTALGRPDVSMGSDHENQSTRGQLWHLLRR